MTDAPRTDPVLRVIPQPSDINTNGHIFGGWVLSQMDLGGGVIAARTARGPVATVAIEAMKFIAPILPGDVVSVYAHVARRGTTSVSVAIEVMSERHGGTEATPVTSGLFTFVAIDEHARPKPLPPAE